MKKQTLTMIAMITLLLGITFLLLLCCTNAFEINSESNEEIELTEFTVGYAQIKEESYLGVFTDPDSGRMMDYHIYIPSDATENMPLIVYLHGTGAIGNTVFNEQNPAIIKATEAYGDEFPFILLAPSSMFNRSWNVKYMPSLLKMLIDDTVNRYNIDQSKIIIIGHSMGAAGVFRQVELYGDFYSAAVPVSVPNIENIDIDKCLNVPMWGFAGTEESPHDYNMRKLFEKLEELGGNVQFTVLEGADHGKSADYAFTREMYEWAIGQ